MEQLTWKEFEALAKEKCPRQYEYLEMLESSLNDEKVRMALGLQNDVFLAQKGYDHKKNQIIEIINQPNLSPLKYSSKMGEKFKEVDANLRDYTKIVNKQFELGYELVNEISRTTSKVTEPDARGMSYGGETMVKLLFKKINQ